MALVMAEQVYESQPGGPTFWEIVRSQGIKIPKSFLAYNRNEFIPFGAVCYMPEEWGTKNKRDIDRDTRTWDVVCSAKDIGYHQWPMMELFCKEVLPLMISEPCTAEILYEYWEKPEVIQVTPASPNRVNSLI